MIQRNKKKKLLKLLYELSPQEEREKLILEDTAEVHESMQALADAIEDIHKKSAARELDLVAMVQRSIETVRGDMSDTFESHKREIMEGYKNLLGTFKEFEEKNDGKHVSVSKSLKGDLLKEMGFLSKRIQSLADKSLPGTKWGGSSRTLYLNGVPMSPQNRYSDINFVPGTGISMTVVNNDKTLRADVTISATGGSGGSNSIFGEIVSGSGTSWVLANTPIGTIFLAANGQVLTLTSDYTISGKNITTLSSWSAGTVQAAYNK